MGAGVEGVPHVRISVRGPNTYLFSNAFSLSINEKHKERGYAPSLSPTYADANMGHPSAAIRIFFRGAPLRPVRPLTPLL